MYDSIMSEEVDMNVENEEDVGVKVEHVDCSHTLYFSGICVICFCWYSNYITYMFIDVRCFLNIFIVVC